MQPPSTPFNPAKREQFLELIGTGQTIGNACSEVGVSRTTIAKWCTRGEAGKSPEAVEFKTRYAEMRELAAANGQAKLEPGFTPPRRERFLTLIEAGRTIGEACADVGISRTTVNAWDVRGQDGQDPEAAAFSERFNALRHGTQANGLTLEDVIRLLERSARKGSVQAMKLLLDRPWEKNDAGDESSGEPEDPFTALEGDELAQRRTRSRSA